MTRLLNSLIGAPGCLLAALALACGGGSNTMTAPPVTTGSVGFLTTDATSETWSSVDVIIRKASLVLASDAQATSPIRIFDGSTDTTQVNLLQEDQIFDLITHTQGVPAGTYDRLILEVDGQPANITLVPAVDPATGLTPAPIDPALISVRGTVDPAHPTWVVLPTIPLSAPVTVTAGSASAVAVDFDLAHPAFIVQHDVTTASGSQTLYAVNFGTAGIFRQKTAPSLPAYYLRRHFGTVQTVAPDLSSLVIATDHGQTFTIFPDQGASPTLFYDLDILPVAAQASNLVPAALLPGAKVACMARYQPDGSLTAVRLWYASASAGLARWNPEGHITRVDAAGNLIYVQQGRSDPMAIAIADTTKWFFHGNAGTDLSGGAGRAFLANADRYFKVQVSLEDPSASPPVAASVDIQRAMFEGNITSASASGFTYTKVYGDQTVSTHTLGYGAAFSCWDFTFPGLARKGAPAFLGEANTGIVLNAGGRTLKAYGISSLDWPAGATAWSAQNTVFTPIQISPFAQTVTTGYASGSLQITGREAGALPITVLLDGAGQEPTLVNTFTRQAGSRVAITPQDATTWGSVLTAGARVRVYGVPDGSGNLKAYYINVYN